MALLSLVLLCLRVAGCLSCLLVLISWWYCCSVVDCVLIVFSLHFVFVVVGDFRWYFDFEVGWFVAVFGWFVFSGCGLLGLRISVKFALICWWGFGCCCGLLLWLVSLWYCGFVLVFLVLIYVYSACVFCVLVC